MKRERSVMCVQRRVCVFVLLADFFLVLDYSMNIIMNCIEF